MRHCLTVHQNPGWAYSQQILKVSSLGLFLAAFMFQLSGMATQSWPSTATCGYFFPFIVLLLGG